MELLACQGGSAQAQDWRRQGNSGLAQSREIHLADAEEMTGQSVGIDQKIVHGTEFHLVGVLIYTGKNLRKERRKDLSLKWIGEAMSNDEPFLERHHGPGDILQFGEAIDDFRWRPIGFSRLIEGFREALGFGH
jgi:hypothetical protein